MVYKISLLFINKLATKMYNLQQHPVTFGNLLALGKYLAT